MPYRQEDLNRLDEEAFRVNILIPLLKAVGYRDVEHYHGPHELGKDIVGWRASEDGSQEYCAIVAKIGKINASAAGDAANVTTQIRQAFGSTFTNKVTGADAQTHKVIVAATGKIGERSREAIRTQLDTYARHVRFWDGDTIVDLMNEHLPDRGIVADLERLRPKLTNFNSFQVQTTLTSEGTVFRVAGKERGAEVAQARIRFPESTEGKRAADTLQKFIDEGGSVAIPGEFIEEFHLHDELRSLFGAEAPASIQIVQSELGKHLPIRLEVDGDKNVVEGLVLRGGHGGNKQKVFRTETNDAIKAKLTSYTRKLCTAVNEKGGVS